MLKLPLIIFIYHFPENLNYSYPSLVENLSVANLARYNKTLTMERGIT